MRANGLLAAAALFLAGCGPGEITPDPGPNAARPAPVGSAGRKPAAPAPTAPKAAVEDAIPAAFHGVYDSSPEACGRPSDGRLAVTARELRFHESIGSVRSVTPGAAGRIRVEADYQGEGERWRNSHELRLSTDGAGLTISGDGVSFDRVRCRETGR